MKVGKNAATLAMGIALLTGNCFGGSTMVGDYVIAEEMRLRVVDDVVKQQLDEAGIDYLRIAREKLPQFRRALLQELSTKSLLGFISFISDARYAANSENSEENERALHLDSFTKKEGPRFTFWSRLLEYEDVLAKGSWTIDLDSASAEGDSIALQYICGVRSGEGNIGLKLRIESGTVKIYDVDYGFDEFPFDY